MTAEQRATDGRTIMVGSLQLIKNAKATLQTSVLMDKQLVFPLDGLPLKDNAFLQ